MSWRAVYWTAAKEETFSETAEACVETVLAKQVVTKLELDQGGVLGAAAARRLDKSRYRLSEEGATVSVQEPVSFLKESAARLEEFIQLVHDAPRVIQRGFSFRNG